MGIEMTLEEKVAILKKAGVWDVVGFPTCIDKLFNLVAAAEREACAKVCDDIGDSDNGYGCAAAIRARGEK